MQLLNASMPKSHFYLVQCLIISIKRNILPLCTAVNMIFSQDDPSSSITLSQVVLGRAGGLRQSGGGRNAAAMTR